LHHSWLAPWWIGRTGRTTLLVVGEVLSWPRCSWCWRRTRGARRRAAARCAWRSSTGATARRRQTRRREAARPARRWETPPLRHHLPPCPLQPPYALLRCSFGHANALRDGGAGFAAALLQVVSPTSHGLLCALAQ
jgi:hypothetical protein